MKYGNIYVDGKIVAVTVDGDATGCSFIPDVQVIDPAAIERLHADRMASGEAVESDPPRQFELAPPVFLPRKIVCVGLNYRAHAEETGAPLPPEPILFLKTSQTVVGPNADVLLPLGSTATDYEVELAVVIGREARYVRDDENPLDYVFGYTISNDVSERAFQLERGGQWDKGKNCESFNPLGPWIVTADEIPDPQDLVMSLKVNGENRQAESTSDMIFPVSELIRYISQFMVLEPGDVINTGTPSGVAMGRTDKPYLREGDVVEVEIRGIGKQCQHIVRAER